MINISIVSISCSCSEGPFALIDTVTSQQRVIGGVTADARHRAVESQSFTETLLHKLKFGNVIHGWLRATIPGIQRENTQKYMGIGDVKT